ncbi:DgaE family pyridoxal phosphate-dependent ammonia lyase [Companilactobacillus allii]|uniref:L-seryl-tRNA selenium transferase n=1 Tax=Companilactobacillus allii TaxID=1847728 RepID=A0A1P8Q1W7_9LACO|nr:DgaE family pyridoxal phosphate-dependent ammonia lyase [Companilactobacillus allii]APX71817.1 L-seryl-tRNA selenium transferase [Companilactobacillus allii]USQ68904.1 DgaE family pyridoxal phosphate-dependent ammonia lyase [Companilactobacillus allii]
MENIYDKYDLKQVVNASGKMTILGVSKVSDDVLEAQKFGGQNFFEISDLVLKTGQHLAKVIGSEDGVVLASASAAIAQSVAAIIGKGSLHHVYHPFDERYTNREIIIPKGQNVDYGTPEEVMIELGGGKVVEAGYANMCSKEHIEMMITDKTAAILYVKSHHAVQKSMLSVEEAIEVAHKHNLPLILDAAAEENLKKYINMNADVVIYSGAKAFSGPSSCLTLGKKPYIDWIRLQSKGIGRAMKIGKDNILGLTKAIEDYLKFGPENGDSMKERLTPFVKELNSIKGIDAKVVQDAAGRDIYRASVTVSDNSSIDAMELIDELKKDSPAIYTREYRANMGIIEFDIRAVHDTEMKMIVGKIKQIMKAV